jgi:hypothetical protein
VKLLRAGGLLVIAYLIAAVLLSPYLYDAVKQAPPGTIRSPGPASSDLLGFFVPRVGTLVGGNALRHVTASFVPHPINSGAYLSIPLVLAVVAFVTARRRERGTWMLLSLMVVPALLSLGPRLHVGGNPSIVLPGNVIAHLPLIRNARPDRFTLYMWLAAAVVASSWLAWGARAAWARWAVIVLAAILIVPAVPSPPFHPSMSAPSFVRTDAYRRYLSPGENVLVMPYSQGGEMLWQALDGFSYRLARGYLGPVPRQDVHHPLARNIAVKRMSTLPPAHALRSFIRLHGVDAIAVANPHPRAWDELVRPLAGAPIHVGDVDLYRVKRLKR